MSLIEKRSTSNTNSSNKLTSSVSNSSLISLENTSATTVKYNLYKFDKSVVHLNYKKHQSNREDENNSELDDYDEVLSDDIKGNYKKINKQNGFCNLYKYILNKIRRKCGLVIALIFLFFLVSIFIYVIYVLMTIIFFCIFNFFGLFVNDNIENCNGLWHQENTVSFFSNTILFDAICKTLYIILVLING